MTTISTFASPILWQKIAQEINVELAKLGHFDDVYPVASIGFDGDETFPEMYKNDGTKTNFRLLPDSTRAMSFFVVSGDMIEIDEFTLECPMSLCVWMNLQLLDDTKEYDYTQDIVKDCYNVLRNYGCFEIAVDINTPFSEFTQMTKDVSANIMRPYSGFRINFTKTINVCKT